MAAARKRLEESAYDQAWQITNECATSFDTSKGKTNEARLQREEQVDKLRIRGAFVNHAHKSRARITGLLITYKLPWRTATFRDQVDRRVSPPRSSLLHNWIGISQ
jgi:hypothetical protein